MDGSRYVPGAERTTKHEVFNTNRNFTAPAQPFYLDRMTILHMQRYKFEHFLRVFQYQPENFEQQRAN